jgi:hypothetical protein
VDKPKPSRAQAHEKSHKIRANFTATVETQMQRKPCKIGAVVRLVGSRRFRGDATAVAVVSMNAVVAASGSRVVDATVTTMRIVHLG